MLEYVIRKRRRLWLLIGIVIIVFLCLSWLVKLWWGKIEAQAHAVPTYEKVDIEPILSSKISSEKINSKKINSVEMNSQEKYLEQSDYEILFQQTGLGKAAVDYLIANNRQQDILEIQENYFADVEVKCNSNTIVTREERIASIVAPASATQKDAMPATRVFIPYVEKGDILITFNCHLYGWRNGHVGIVVDEEKRLTLEASELGTDSKIVSMNHWERYPSFIILRLKDASKEERAAIADYAAEHLVDIDYGLHAGIIQRAYYALSGKAYDARRYDERQYAENKRQLGRSGAEEKTIVKAEWERGKNGEYELDIEEPESTHCAHLTWYSYRQFGYDLDSDGGVIVTPRDIYESSLLEIVQVYGMDM